VHGYNDFSCRYMVGPVHDWQKQFETMRAQFLSRAQDRLANIEQLLRTLEMAPDAEMLRDVRTHFHWLAGSGGTYKFPKVTDLGVHGEEICDEFLEAGKTIDLEGVGRLNRILRGVREQFLSATNA
jgi:chemotaxis protein histidine kinase CheA